MSNRKLGKFYLHSDQVLQTTGRVAEILGKLKFVPTRVEFIAHRNQFEYIGLSPLFEDVTVGAEVPEYALEVSNDKENRVISVHGNRV